MFAQRGGAVAEACGERRRRRLRPAGSSAPRPAAFDAQGARPADGIFEQLEGEHFADREIAESRPLAQVAPVEEDMAAIGQADETVPLPEHQRHDSARPRRPSRRHIHRRARRRLSHLNGSTDRTRTDSRRQVHHCPGGVLRFRR